MTRQPTSRRVRGTIHRVAPAIAVLVLAVVVAGCGWINRNELTGRTWQLVSITETVPAFQGVVPAADQSRYTILFNDDGTAAIQADCNSVQAEYTTENEQIRIVPGASTLAMCPEDSLGTQFVTALSGATSYNVYGNGMTLYILNEGRLEFVVKTE